MRIRGSKDFIADRRRRALKLLSRGLSLHEAARQIGCHASSVMRWRNIHKKKGKEVFVVGASPGRPPKLTNKQRRKIVAMLLEGAMKHGYRTDLWTTQRIADLIRKHFRIKYHRDHVGRIMHQLGWSHQKPERRAAERNEKEIERWKKEEWPRVKKTPRGWAPTSSSSMSRDSS